MKSTILRILAAVSLIVVSASAKADEAADYKKFAEETREWVYSMDLPAFEVREIPEKYKDESAVYIAIYNNLYILRPDEQRRLAVLSSREKYVEQGILERSLVYILYILMIRLPSMSFRNMISSPLRPASTGVRVISTA